LDGASAPGPRLLVRPVNRPAGPTKSFFRPGAGPCSTRSADRLSAGLLPVPSLLRVSIGRIDGATRFTDSVGQREQLPYPGGPIRRLSNSGNKADDGENGELSECARDRPTPRAPTCEKARLEDVRTNRTLLSNGSPGFSRLPLKVGSRARNHVKPADGEPKGSKTLFTLDCALEINRNEKPAQAVRSGTWPWDRCER
jgi:hypothetical protein